MDWLAGSFGFKDAVSSSIELKKVGLADSGLASLSLQTALALLLEQKEADQRRFQLEIGAEWA